MNHGLVGKKRLEMQEEDKILTRLVLCDKLEIVGC